MVGGVRLIDPANESSPVISPGGRWAGYSSDASGSREAWVTDFPAATGRRQVTTGGVGSAWGWIGEDEIGWLDSERRIVAATIRRKGGDLEVGAPRVLFGGRVFATDDGTVADYSPARRRLILARPAGFSTEEPDLVVVSDWRAALDDGGQKP